MAQYINKDALIAEIERLERENKKSEYVYDSLDTEYILKSIISFINTLEVKEVDSLTPEEIKKICIIYDNLKQERECATVLYNSDETFFNHVLMEYKSIAQKGE